MWYSLRVPHCMSPRRNETLPTPHPQANVPLPPEPGEGGGHTRLRVRGLVSPNSDDWRKGLALCLLWSVTEFWSLFVRVSYLCPPISWRPRSAVVELETSRRTWVEPTSSYLTFPSHTPAQHPPQQVCLQEFRVVDIYTNNAQYRTNLNIWNIEKCIMNKLKFRNVSAFGRYHWDMEAQVNNGPWRLTLEMLRDCRVRESAYRGPQNVMRSREAVRVLVEAAR